MKKTETKNIDLEKLVFSKTSPRTIIEKFNSADPDFIELCSSVKQHGVIQNILVRPAGKKFEIVDGERRVRASKKNGLKSIKAEVRALTDVEVMEIQLIGFEHKKGIHPLAEASAMQALIDTGVHTIQTVADRLGKKVQYVAQRVQLLKLSDDIKKTFAEGKIELGHALLIAKHQPADQNKIMKYLEGSNFRYSAEQVRQWIGGTLMLNLSKAPFKIKDELLFPDAGSCIDCLKRTGSNADLFPEVSGNNICTDPACYKEKVELHIRRALEKAEAEGKPLLKLDDNYFAKTKKDVIGALDYVEYNAKHHPKELAHRAIIVKGKAPGKYLTVVLKENLTTEKAPEAKKVPTPAELAEHENSQIKEQRDLQYRNSLGALLLGADIKKEILPPIAGAIVQCSFGDWLPDYFHFTEAIDFGSLDKAGITEAFNGGVITAAMDPDGIYPAETLEEIAKYLGVDYKTIREKVNTENPLVTVEEIKKRLKQAKQEN